MSLSLYSSELWLVDNYMGDLLGVLQANVYLPPLDCAYQVCLKRLVSAQIHPSRFVSFWNWVELHFLFAFQYLRNKVSLNFSYIIFLGVNFENLTVEFHILYVINMHIKFHLNQILFTIWLINLFFIYNFRLQKFEIITFIWWHSN